MSIEEIIDKLVGDITIHGETYADCESLKNLDNARTIILHLIDKISKNCEYKNDVRYSVKKICKASREILFEINDYC